MKKLSFLLYIVLVELSNQISSNDKANTGQSPRIIRTESSNIDNITNDNPLTVVFYNTSALKQQRQYRKIIEAISLNFSAHELVFCEIILPKSKAKHIGMDFFIGKYKRRYKGSLAYESMNNWIYEIYFARPHKKEKLEQIEEIDSHYFIYVEDSYKRQNEERMKKLAMLVHPLAIIHGLDVEEKRKIAQNNQNSPLWIYREYKKEIIPLDLETSLEHISQYALLNEFPSYVYLDSSSIKLIKHYKVPSLIYYTDNPNEIFIETLKEIVLEFKAYLMLAIVDLNKKDKNHNFMKGFMKVEKGPSIRILNMREKVQRFKFIGPLQKDVILNFLQNYINGNLQSYNVNEHVALGTRINGIAKGNYRSYQKAITYSYKTHLIYVYSSEVKHIKRHFRILKKIKKLFKKNGHFDVMAINHDINDTDGYFNDDVPYILVTTGKDTVAHYEGNIEFEAIVHFIIQLYPRFEINNDILTDELYITCNINY